MGIGEFGHDLASCATLNDVCEIFRKEIERHGYTSTACRAFVPAKTGAQSRLLFRSWPKGWAELSDKKGFAARSPVIAVARTRMTPFTWLDAMNEQPLTSAEREVWSSAFAWGWKNGYVLPLHGPGGYFATVSMASMEPDLDLRPEQRAYLQMIATLAHERCLVLADLAAPDEARGLMSARELECLRWVAAGKTDWEISVILSISAATVKFHVDGARKKLHARNRAQAVARLVLLGLH